MRHPIILTLVLTGVFGLSACDTQDEDVEAAKEVVNALDDTNLSSLMLSSTSPEEGVAYFERASKEKPDRIDLKRGLAISLTRAGQPARAVTVWREVLQMEGATEDDKVALADTQIRDGNWDGAAATLNTIPPTFESFRRYQLEAMVADSKQEWKKADSFYEIAVGLTTQPSGVLNNWGYSKLTRGDYPAAERLFTQALSYDPSLFTAKNNIVLARGAQQNYTLPVVEMSQTERAELLYTLGLAAVKQGDVTIGRSLLQEAVDSHPQHFEAAARSLDALEKNVTN